MAMDLDGIDEDSVTTFYPPCTLSVGHDSAGRQVDYETAPTETEKTIAHLWASRTPNNTEYDLKAGASVNWGDPKGPTFSGYAQAEARNKQNRVEVKVEQKSDGTGSASLSGAHTPKSGNEDCPK